MSLKLDKRMKVCVISDKVRFLSKNELFLYLENAENLSLNCSVRKPLTLTNKPNQNSRLKVLKYEKPNTRYPETSFTKQVDRIGQNVQHLSFVDKAAS